MPGLVNRRRFRVDFGDCDPARIVYYPNYFEWFDRSTQDLLAAAGLPLHKWTEETGILIPLVAVRSDFAAAAAWGDELAIDSSVARWGRSSFDVGHAVINAETGARIADATETHACVRFDPVDPKRIKPVAIPAAFKQALSRG